MELKAQWRSRPIMDVLKKTAGNFSVFLKADLKDKTLSPGDITDQNLKAMKAGRGIKVNRERKVGQGSGVHAMTMEEALTIRLAGKKTRRGYGQKNKARELFNKILWRAGGYWNETTLENYRVGFASQAILVAEELKYREKARGWRWRIAPNFRQIGEQITGPEGLLASSEMDGSGDDFKVSFSWVAESAKKAMQREDGQEAVSWALKQTEKDFVEHMGPEFSKELEASFNSALK